MAHSRRIAGIAVALTAATSLGVVAAAPAGATPPQDPREVQITRFLGEQRLPHRMPFEGTTVGGLSGIDRDPRTNTWYFISDDRWRYDPARFYTGRLDI